MTDAWGSIRQEAAQVLLAEGIVIDGSLHLLSRTNYPPGPETPLEMLNRADPFFALTRSGGGALFIPKAQAALVTCHRVPPADPERFTAAKLVALDVVVVGGREIRGRAVVEMPPERSRALDYVNGAGGFFSVWADDVTHYVNKSLVRMIRPLD